MNVQIVHPLWERIVSVFSVCNVWIQHTYELSKMNDIIGFYRKMSFLGGRSGAVLEMQKFSHITKSTTVKFNFLKIFSVSALNPLEHKACKFVQLLSNVWSLGLSPKFLYSPTSLGKRPNKPKISTLRADKKGKGLTQRRRLFISCDALVW